MKLFFTYYGGKYRVARSYPTPKYDKIIEPFAGSAGYSLRYPEKQVHLFDLDPIICGLWDYLIKASPEDIMKLPNDVDRIDDLKICQEAKWLIGFWLNKGTVQPSKSPSRWMRDKTRPNSFWGQVIKERIASQVDGIKHWKISNKSYDTIENKKATWFIDPPYQLMGKYYKFSSIDYNKLGIWSKERNGQVIVCEQNGADWLPFIDFKTIKATEGKHGKSKSKEVIWTKDEM